jgi:beta-aspartyl-peptidase (threonine type)
LLRNQKTKMMNLQKLLRQLLFAGIILFSACREHQKLEYALILHGGAGALSAEATNDSLQKAYTAALEAARDSGIKILATGGTSLDAVEKVINMLEDCPLFNAGKGACYTYDGKISLDASIMDGSNLKAGAVAGVSDIKNPISAARKVMTSSPYVMLSGKGASEFAKEEGLKIEDSSYFFTERQWKAHLAGIKEPKKLGTVGCVALDKKGNLAAGTSTGGMMNKKWGRIGDSPVIGAGTYANNKSCGVSCTGSGEYFIRLSIARDMSAMVEYKNSDVQLAADEIIQKKLTELGGQGGLIALDSKGKMAISFNTPGMFRAYGDSKGKKFIGIFK